jgi:cytochrome d ubiquinol oxidase subunit II
MIDAVAAVMLVSLIAYCVLAGADFGGGVWELFATGSRAERQRRLVDDAIAPVWEANHVWLILIVVLLFTGFPPAFAAASIGLHVPLTLMLIGIVLRGSAWAFRRYGGRPRWGRVFAFASAATPIFLGISLGAVTSGALRMGPDGAPELGFFRPWLAPFPLAVGAFALALFAYVAAVYLAVEADDPELRDDFRSRAIISAIAVGACALAAGLLAAPGARHFRDSLLRSPWSWPLQISTGLAAIAALWALWTRRFRAARALAVIQVASIVGGWGAAQYPYLIAPDLTLAAAAAPDSTLRLLLIALAIGGVVLFPSLWWLFRVFKRGDGHSMP